MAVGDVISSGIYIKMPPAIGPRMGPLTAMREALAAYLLSATFRVDGGEDLRDTEFNLNRVYDHWPRPDEALDYPCASIIEVPTTEHDQPLSPEPLEDTLGAFDSMVVSDAPSPHTCLWVTGEAMVQLQVDFWCDLEPDRQAIEAALPDLFSPEEAGSSVVIEAPELYFSQDCEFALVDHHHDDSAIHSQRNERRLRCVLAASCAIVSLRRATLTKTPVATVTVVDPVDRPECEEEE